SPRATASSRSWWTEPRLLMRARRRSWVCCLRGRRSSRQCGIGCRHQGLNESRRTPPGLAGQPPLAQAWCASAAHCTAVRQNEPPGPPLACAALLCGAAFDPHDSGEALDRALLVGGDLLHVDVARGSHRRVPHLPLETLVVDAVPVTFSCQAAPEG